jgi:hypothetical protein
MRIFIYISILFLSLASNAQGFCSKKDLSRKDCSLTSGPYKFRFWNDKIFLSHPVERDTQLLSYSGEKVEWVFAKVQKFGSRLFVQVALWAAPEEKTEVSSLYWTVYEIVKEDIQERLTRVIRKRKTMPNGKWNLDPQLPYHLKLDKNQVVWRVDRESGTLSAQAPVEKD